VGHRRGTGQHSATRGAMAGIPFGPNRTVPRPRAATVGKRSTAGRSQDNHGRSLAFSGATGLRFVYDGSTSEAPSRQRSPYQPERYGDRWATVLISWTTPSENPDFAADVLGQAGSTPVGLPYQSSAYVTGEVELDPGRLSTIRQWPNGNGVRRRLTRARAPGGTRSRHIRQPADVSQEPARCDRLWRR
jgi:hypothetical protein